jgi:hypothetical protein
LQQLDFFSLFDQKQPIGVATRSEVKTEVTAQRAARLDWIIMVLAGQPLETAEDVFAGKISVLKPAFVTMRIAHPLPSLAMLENRYTISVTHCSGFGINRRDSVAQRGLRSSHVEHFFLPAGSMAACRKEDYESE